MLNMTIKSLFILHLSVRSTTLWTCSVSLISLLLWTAFNHRSSSISIVRRHVGSTDWVDITDNSVEVNLTRRDDYSCSHSKPCSNGACCGKSGFCGYGPTYCGDGCQANCDAKAECGQFAQQKGKECPLNTCCSQFGFVSIQAQDNVFNLVDIPNYN